VTLIRRGSAKKKHEARRAWLKPDVDLYHHVPGIHDDVTENNRVALDRLCAVMRAHGLFGASQSAALQRETVRRLLSELRGEDVGVGW
jgi:hypothetical protein